MIRFFVIYFPIYGLVSAWLLSLTHVAAKPAPKPRDLETFTLLIRRFW